MTRITVLAAAVLLAATSLGLGGCASEAQTAAKPAEPTRDLTTLSDETNADRRAQVRFELANAYFERGQVETALDEVKLALQAKPDFGAALALRGLIYAALNQPELADDSFREALRVNPQDGDTMNSYGWFLCQRGKYDQAEKMFQQALAQPQYRDVKRTLHARGVCLSRAGRWVEAEGALMRAYELDPSNPVIGFNLAEVLYQRQEYERAKFYIGRVNATEAGSNAQTLWLAARIAHRLGDQASVDRLGEQLRSRYPQSPQTLEFERGKFDGS
jgi:type IV pilus assembly protein PilF